MSDVRAEERRRLEERARLVRRVAVGLHIVPLALVAAGLAGVLWALGAALVGHPGDRSALVAALYVPVLAGLLTAGVVGLRRWVAGGRPTLLYGFDALPVLFLLFTAGPAALHDTRGLLFAAAFVVPGVLAWAASAGGRS